MNLEVDSKGEVMHIRSE